MLLLVGGQALSFYKVPEVYFDCNRRYKNQAELKLIIRLGNSLCPDWSFTQTHTA